MFQHLNTKMSVNKKMYLQIISIYFINLIKYILMSEYNKFLINLNNRPDRLVHTLNQLKKVGLSNYIVRIEAYDEKMSKNVISEYINKDAYDNIKNIKNVYNIPNLNALGCAISHLKCWEYIADKATKHNLIFEDNIEIKDTISFEIDINKIKRIVEDNPSKPLFISFNSEQLIFSNKFFTSNLDESLEKIKNPFIGMNFYYLNVRMARLLLRNIKTISNQIDIEVGLIANKIYSPRNDFCIYKTNSICRNKKFISDIQFYILGIDELIHILNLPEDICIKIYDYIPHLFKMNRFRSSFNFYCNKNLLENGSDYNYD